MAFISVPLKKSAEVDLSQPMRRWITTYSGVVKPQDDKAIAELNSLRKNAVVDQADVRESSLSILYRYFDQLFAINTKSPFNLTLQVDVPFRWTNAFDKGGWTGWFTTGSTFLTTANGGYERASVLFNIAALQSQIAAGQSRDSDAELKVCSKLFQQSAGIFHHLKENIGSMVGQELTTDLKPEVLGALSALMLAQGQEAFYLKAARDNMKPSIIAKLAQQAAEFYGDAYKLMNVESLKVLWKTDWLTNVGAKSTAFEAIAHYQQSLIHHAAKEYGTQVAYLQRAMDLFSGNVTSVQLFAEDVAKIQSAHQTAKKDNDFIYHERIPDPKNLPPIGKTALAKLLPFSPPLSGSANFTDLFSHLVPAALHQAVARFEEKRKAAIESETGRLREASELMNTILLDSLNLPAALDDVGAAGGSSSSAGLLEAVSRLRGLLSQVESLKGDRAKIEAELRKLADDASDQKTSFLRALTQSGGAKEEDITKEQLENTFSAIREQISQSVEAQQRLLREVELAHAEFVREGGTRFSDRSSKSSHKVHSSVPQKLLSKFKTWIGTAAACPICLESYDELKKVGTSLQVAHCGHVFCQPCIEAVLRKGAENSICPTCRAKIEKGSVHRIYL